MMDSAQDYHMFSHLDSPVSLFSISHFLLILNVEQTPYFLQVHDVFRMKSLSQAPINVQGTYIQNYIQSLNRINSLILYPHREYFHHKGSIISFLPSFSGYFNYALGIRNRLSLYLKMRQTALRNKDFHLKPTSLRNSRYTS